MPLVPCDRFVPGVPAVDAVSAIGATGSHRISMDAFCAGNTVVMMLTRALTAKT
jgi:hypothetical protein